MAKEIEEEIVEEEVQEPSAMDGLLGKLQKESAEAEPEFQSEEEVEEVLEEPESPKEPEKPAGPSLAMKAFAKREGLPEEVIAIAASDEHLNALVEFAAAKKEQEKEPKQEPTEEEVAFQLDLPEDEFPADDSIRKALDGMNKHYVEQNQKVMDYISQMADWMVKQDQQQKAGIENQYAQVQHTFDSHLDSLGIDALGQQQSLNSVGMKARNMVYDYYLELREASPEASHTELIDRAVSEFGFSNKQAKHDAAIKDANSRRLGGRPSPLKGETVLTGGAKMEALLEGIKSRTENKV